MVASELQPPFRASAHLTSHNAGRRRWRPGAFDQRGCVQPPPHASVGATEKRRPRGKNRSSCDWHSTVQIQETVRSAARLVQLNYPSNFSRRVCRPINRVNLSAPLLTDPPIGRANTLCGWLKARPSCRQGKLFKLGFRFMSSQTACGRPVASAQGRPQAGWRPNSKDRSKCARPKGGPPVQVQTPVLL